MSRYSPGVVNMIPNPLKPGKYLFQVPVPEADEAKGGIGLTCISSVIQRRREVQG